MRARVGKKFLTVETPGLHNVGVDGPETCTKNPDVKSFTSKSMKCQSCAWFAKVENPLAPRMCPHVLAELADKMQALRNTTNKSNGKVEMWTSDKTSSGLGKRRTMSFAENCCLLTPSKNLTSECWPAESLLRESVQQDRGVDVRQKYLQGLRKR